MAASDVLAPAMIIDPSDLPDMGGDGKVHSFLSRSSEMLMARRIQQSREPGLPIGAIPPNQPVPRPDGHGVAVGVPPKGEVDKFVPPQYSAGYSVTDYPIAIIGAGMAGLYAAMILQDLGLDYEIIEASDRIGGRVFTHRFSETTKFHDYFDVGAMRFPNSGIMERTFELFKMVGLGDVKAAKGSKERGRLIKYKMKAEGENQIRMYNGIRTTAMGDDGKDTFAFGIDPFYTEYKLNGRSGASALVEYAIGSFKEALLKDFKTGWANMMKYDDVPMRVYLRKMIVNPNPAITDPAEKVGLPANVVNWIEAVNNASGSLDRGLTEHVLSDLDFNLVDIDDWWCIDGGTELLAEAMVEYLKTHEKPKPAESSSSSDGQPEINSNNHRQPKNKHIYLNRRVTGIAMHHHPSDTARENPLMKLSVQDYPEYDDKLYSHVITTVPFPCLRSMDLSNAGLSPKQNEAARTLTYGPSVKIGIKFRERWWEKWPALNIRGGLSKTDLPIRTVVYPSYTDDDPDNQPGVLMASYAWTQDSSRLGALCQGKGTKAEAHLLDMVYRDLATLHSTAEHPITAAQLKAMTLDYYAHDFYHNEYSMGAFAYFTAGQFSTLFPEIIVPAAKGNLHLAGEAASTHHAWIVGALDSAWRSIYELLVKERRWGNVLRLVTEWGGVPEEYPLFCGYACVMRGVEGERVAAEELAQRNPEAAEKAEAARRERGVCEERQKVATGVIEESVVAVPVLAEAVAA
ncbi:hypothetical protein EDC01DRAFT_774681 [Geopyxis carbonaria]|nr:hypothetical protein EDC01DRAFT_774681 [Geopyxis carbonaria]